MDPDALAKAFVDHYYATFDTNRAGLATLYQDGSMLTFEGAKFMGAANIASKLTSLPFALCQHTIATVDCQLSGPQGGMIVFVSGNIATSAEEQQRPHKFSQVGQPYHPIPLFPASLSRSRVIVRFLVPVPSPR
jgi:glycine/serine hydroxymethyltransferase